jgi:hypothetical protein
VSYFFRIPLKSLLRLAGLGVVLLLGSACDMPAQAPEEPRAVVSPMEPEHLELDKGEILEKYVDFSSPQISACEWQKRIERLYYNPATGRFRVLGYVELRAPPEERRRRITPLSIPQILLSVVEFVLPWDFFKGIKAPDQSIRPWGRSDVRAHSLSSYAFLSQAANQIPDRKEFIELVNLALSKKPSDYLKLIAFRAGLRTGVIDFEKKRNEVVQEEIEKVFPGLFSTNEIQDLSESLAMVLVRNALQQDRDFTAWELKIFSSRLPVFRSGGWKALSEDMRLGVGAAINGLHSNSRSERACAANILYRSTEQLMQLMGQETLPLFETDQAQSFVPSLESILQGPNSQKIVHCSSAGSFLKNGRRVRMDEKTLTQLSSVADAYTWAARPYALSHCSPRRNETAAPQTHAGFVAASSTSPTQSALSLVLDRTEAFSHYLFAVNPGARWWKNRSYPLGEFNTLAQILQNRSLVPIQMHALALAYTQLDLLKFEKDHLLFLDESGRPTTDQDNAFGIRISENRLTNQSQYAVSELDSVLRLLDLLSKFERYLASLEVWSRSSQARSAQVEKLFGSRENLNSLLSANSGANREMIEQFHLASSLLLSRFINRDDPSRCYSRITTHLATGEETLTGDCGPLKKALASRLDRLAQRLNSPLLKRQAEQLEGIRD